MESSYKDIVLTNHVEESVVVPNTIYNYEEVIELYESSKQDIGGSFPEEYKDFAFGMMEKVRHIKEEYMDFGFMNSFEYKDICDIINSCVHIEVLPEILSEDESDLEEDDYAGI